MGEWREVQIADVAEVVGGGTPPTKEPSYWDGNIPWLTPKDLALQQERWVSKGQRNISEDGLENSSARLLPSKTVLLTSRAPIGYVALAKNPVATNQGFKSLIVKEPNDPVFFYYLMKHSVPRLEAVAYSFPAPANKAPLPESSPPSTKRSS